VYSAGKAIAEKLKTDARENQKIDPNFKSSHFFNLLVNRISRRPDSSVLFLYWFPLISVWLGKSPVSPDPIRRSESGVVFQK